MAVRLRVTLGWQLGMSSLFSNIIDTDFWKLAYHVLMNVGKGETQNKN